MGREGRHISYEPFLFGLAIVGVIYKIYRDGEIRFDWVLGAILLIFLTACVLWIINTRRSKSVDIKLETGKLRNSDVLGAETATKDKAHIDVKTGDAVDTKITGLREK
jgi:hypothetical protein